jgi:hypothetical protein
VAPSAPDNGSVDQVVAGRLGDPVMATSRDSAFIQAKDKTRGDVVTNLDATRGRHGRQGRAEIPGGIVVDDSRYDTRALSPLVEARVPHERGHRTARRADRQRRFSAWDPRKVVVDDPA